MIMNPLMSFLSCRSQRDRRLLCCLAALLAFAPSGCRRPPAPAQISAQPPPKPAGPPEPAPLPTGGVKAVYLTGWTAGHKRHFANLVALVDRTEINAMVIDVKDDGQVSYGVDVPLAKEVGANRKMIGHIDKLMATLKEHDIFPIARISCFRDTILAKKRPDLAVQTANGKVWKDRSGHIWLNPYNKANWDYNVDIALDAIKRGFKEIQFDYVRFPSEGKLSALRYPGKPKNVLRKDQIEAFVKYAREKVRGQGAWFSADVFGLTSLVASDMGIGQTRTNVAKHVDYLCPMVYPSHYARGEYGIKNPNTEPYRIVKLSVGDAKKRLKDIPTCKLRPWLQAFSLYGVHYGPAQVKAQFKAIRELNIDEYLLWNPKCTYTGIEAALAKEKPARVAAAPSGAL